MMLAQFQVRYPTGSLISELLTIYQGKFVVRVSAHVEGVLRATGMAASESLELAEDQARHRALTVLGIEPTKTVEGVEAEAAKKEEKEAEEVEEQKQLKETTNQGEVTNIDELSQQASQSSSAPSTLFSSWYQEPEPQEFGMKPDISSNPLLSFSNVTPLLPRNSGQRPAGAGSDGRFEQEGAGAIETGAVKTAASDEPIDFSDAIARTTVELKRLRWNSQQGREYLKQTYNKRSRQELTDEEMMEFLHYLESQPSPNQPFT